MKTPANLEYVTINENKGRITNVDIADLGEDYAIELRGVTLSKEGEVLRRDYGTKYRFSSMPSGTLQTGFLMLDIETNIEHEIILSTDASNNLRIYVDKSVDSTGNWLEITRTISATISSVPGGSSILITGITENGAAKYLSTNANHVDNVGGWICANLTRRTAEVHVVGNAASPTSPLVRLTTGTAHGLTTGDVAYVRDVRCGHATGGIGSVGDRGSRPQYQSNGYWKVTVINSTTVDLIGSDYTGSLPYVANTGYLSGSKSANPVAVVSAASSSGTATATLTLPTFPDSTGMNWKVGDSIILYQSTALYNGFNQAKGTTPHVRFNSIESQKKVNVYSGSSANPPVMDYPVSIQKRSARNLFIYGVTLDQYYATLKETWYLEHGGGGLCPYFVREGSASNIDIQDYIFYIIPGQTYKHYVHDFNVQDPWLEIQTNYTDIADGVAHTGHRTLTYGVVVLIYGGYQISDPVYQFHCRSNMHYMAAKVTLGFHINQAKMPKEVTGIRIYTDTFNVDDIAAGLHINTPYTDYKNTREIDIVGKAHVITPADIWTAEHLNPGGFTFQTITNITTNDCLANRGANDLVFDIGHEPDLTRSLLKPRYVTKAQRSQGTMIVVDDGDSTLRNSGYGDGGKKHMDDVFPDRATDLQEVSQREYLLAEGQLLGLTTYQGSVIAVKSSNIETFDILGGASGIDTADALAKQGIIDCSPWGFVLCGSRGIWFYPSHGGNRQEISLALKSEYDGTDRTADGTVKITEAARAAIIATYNRHTEELVVQIQVNLTSSTTEHVCYIYNFKTQRWRTRKFESAVKWFTTRGDKTLSIGLSTGLLKYPDNTVFKDSVAFGGTGGVGYQTILELNLGSIVQKYPTHILYSLRFTIEGSTVTETGKMEVRLFANKETTCYNDDTTPHAILIDNPSLMKCPPRGQVECTRIRLSLPDAVDCKDLVISEIEVGVIPITKRLGNK